MVLDAVAFGKSSFQSVTLTAYIGRGKSALFKFTDECKVGVDMSARSAARENYGFARLSVYR